MESAIAPQDEVRECAQCHAPAVVLVHEWKRTVNGLSTNSSTRDYRCQNCGAKFSLHRKVQTWTFIIMGLIMAPALFPLGFTWFGWRRLQRDKKNPVMPAGHPRPPMKFRVGPPARKCGSCGAPVILGKVTRNSTNGVPTGTEYEYACAGCRKQFVIESVWGHVFSSLTAAFVLGISVAFFAAAHHPGWRFGGGGVSLAIAIFLFAQVGVRMANRFRYPVVD
jgi:DNA-directed RNA polymerase subunit RPC12/RpoP